MRYQLAFFCGVRQLALALSTPLHGKMRYLLALELVMEYVSELVMLVMEYVSTSVSSLSPLIVNVFISFHLFVFSITNVVNR